jgi:hypothetical protein
MTEKNKESPAQADLASHLLCLTRDYLSHPQSCMSCFCWIFLHFRHRRRCLDRRVRRDAQSSVTALAGEDRDVACPELDSSRDGRHITASKDDAIQGLS